MSRERGECSGGDEAKSRLFTRALHVQQGGLVMGASQPARLQRDCVCFRQEHLPVSLAMRQHGTEDQSSAK
jgi:hypothetical protein